MLIAVVDLWRDSWGHVPHLCKLNLWILSLCCSAIQSFMPVPSPGTCGPQWHGVCAVQTCHQVGVLGLGELLSHWPLMPGCKTGCCMCFWRWLCCVLAWLLQALFSVYSVNYSGRAAHSVSEGQHPSEVTGVNIIFLERSIPRQKCFCLGAASDIVCSLNTFFQNIIVARNIQAQTELVFMPCCQSTCVLDVTLPAQISGVA